MNIKSTIKDAKKSTNDVLFYLVLDSKISKETKAIYKKELIETSNLKKFI